jgi:hypothetical protein
MPIARRCGGGDAARRERGAIATRGTRCPGVSVYRFLSDEPPHENELIDEGPPEDDDRAMTTRRRRRVSDCFERCDSRTVCIATIGCLTRLSVLHVQELARVSGRMAFGGRTVRVQRGAATSRVTDCGSALRRLAWPARSLPGEWWPPPRFARFASHAPVVCFAGGLMPNALHAPRPRSGRGCSRGCGSRARPVTTGASVVAERPDRDRFAIGVSANTLDMRQVHRDKLLPVRVVKQIR